MAPDAKFVRVGPLAISSAQIFVKFGEDGQSSLPLDAIFDKLPTRRAPTVVALQVKGGPPAPSDVNTDVIVASPLPEHKHVARSLSSSSSSAFERPVLTSVPTTNSQAITPISAASNWNPSFPPGSLGARPISTADISTAGSRTTSYSQATTLYQPLTQSPNIQHNKLARQPPGPRRSRTNRTFSTDDSTAQTEYAEMVFESVPFRYNVLSCLFMWIVLAGFLILPTSFPELQNILQNSSKISKVLRLVGNLPLLIVGFACCGFGAIGLCYIWFRFRHNYVWLLSTIFIPGTFSGISGLISTFVNLYGSVNDVGYSKTTIATIAATGGCAAICGSLTIIYSILKHSVKRRHDRISRSSSGAIEMFSV